MRGHLFEEYVMKRTGKVISYVSAGILLLISLAFIVIEARNLFSGDWTLYENEGNGFLRYFFRLLFALFSLALAVFTYFALKEKTSSILRTYYYFGAIGLFLASNVLSYFATNYIDVLFKLIAAFYSLGALLYFCGTHFAKENKNSKTSNNM